MVACIDSGNMVTVASDLLPLHTGAEPVWLADNDAPNPRTGKRAGQDAAARCQAAHGGRILVPAFPASEAA